MFIGLTSATSCNERGMNIDSFPINNENSCALKIF